VNDFYLGSLQWATGSLLNNPDLTFDDGTLIAHDSVIDIEMDFLVPPEFTLSGCPDAVEVSLGQMLFQTVMVDGTFDDTTFMSPLNYYDFERFMDVSDFSAIESRWGIN